LRYAPGERSCELLLAQALGDAGHTEESYNYFLGLWETQPGDGFINLRLARLAAAKNEVQTAINYYRASIYGTWEGDGALRRREVRLELARYLLGRHDLSSARNELLVAGGNSPDDVALTLTLAPLLEQAGDSRDALAYYEKVLAREPDNRTALENAGRLQYELGHFEDAHRLLEHAAQEHTANGGADLTPADINTLNNSTKILALEPSKKFPPSERVARILRARDIARNRYESCTSQATTANGTDGPLQGLATRWASQEASVGRSALLKDEAKQEVVLKLIFDTETETSKICGMPTGDDALLLLLAQTSKEMTQ
jgi:tetratricopeptide (TPR) repeat protein